MEKCKNCEKWLDNWGFGGLEWTFGVSSVPGSSSRALMRPSITKYSAKGMIVIYLITKLVLIWLNV